MLKKRIKKNVPYETKGVNPDRQVPFAIVEAYKTIRTNLMFMMSQSNKKQIAISSSLAGEGKSTTAVNIAIAFSQLGCKVLLIDADLRRPSVHKKLKLPNTKGLSSVLINLAEADECLNNINPNLDIMTSGPIPPNPMELLSSARMSEMLDALQDKYEYILIDTPPINIVSDALVLAPKTNGIVMVVKDQLSTHDELRKSISAIEFANVKLLGIVLNGSSRREATLQKYRYNRYKYTYK